MPELQCGPVALTPVRLGLRDSPLSIARADFQLHRQLRSLSRFAVGENYAKVNGAIFPQVRLEQALCCVLVDCQLALQPARCCLLPPALASSIFFAWRFFFLFGLAAQCLLGCLMRLTRFIISP